MFNMSGQVLCLFISCFPKLRVRSKWWSEGGYQGRVAINWVTSPPGMAVRQSGCARGIAIITHQVHSHRHHIVICISYHDRTVRHSSLIKFQAIFTSWRKVLFLWPINFSEVHKRFHNSDGQYIHKAIRTDHATSPVPDGLPKPTVVWTNESTCNWSWIGWW